MDTHELYETTIDDIAEHVTIKQIFKAYGDGRIGGSTGPNFKKLEARKLARKKKNIIPNNIQ